MQQLHFDMADAHPLRQRSQLPIKSRIGAIVTTLAAHLIVIIALIEGLEQARIIHPPEIAVQFTPERRKPVALPPSVSPVTPLVIDASAPAITAPEINVSAPAPPMFLPSPPNADYGTSNAEPTWETALLNRLAQAKRMPPSAQTNKQHGVVLLRFTMDRDGKVLTAKIEKSSGYDALDQEALAAIQRAQPLPIPPAEVPSNTIELIVPIDFL